MFKGLGFRVKSLGFGVGFGVWVRVWGLGSRV
jgi:hypothetical protein